MDDAIALAPTAGAVGGLATRAGAPGFLTKSAENPALVAVIEGRLGSEAGPDAMHVHWPRTADSGVTLGFGYDLKKRTAPGVEGDLREAGRRCGIVLDQARIEILKEGVGLTGADKKDGEKSAERFVEEHRGAIGELPPALLEALFELEYPRQEEKARLIATSPRPSGGTDDVNAASRARHENREGRHGDHPLPADYYVLTPDAWEALHPRMRELLADMAYQGQYSYDRVARINEALKRHAGNHRDQFEAVRAYLESLNSKDVRTRSRIDFIRRTVSELSSTHEDLGSGMGAPVLPK